MSNLTDALIAAKLVGGSGGSGGGSGLPEITTEVEVVAEQTITFSSDGGGIYVGDIEGDFSINVGDTLIVNWDGTPYTCVVAELYGSPIWGNSSIEGAGADTGEPFLMGATPGIGIEMETLSGGTHTIQIASEKTNYPDGSILIAIGGEWSLQSGYAFEDNGVITPFSSDFLPTLMYAFEYTTTSETGINANNHSNYIIDASAFGSFTEHNRTYPVVIYGININTNSGHADFDFAVPYAYYQNGQICIGINNVKDTPLVIPSGSKISGVLLIPKVIQLT